ncbi:hypothetical protein psyc5s11_46870 [Clostridium gelidum]|uniref:Methyltransferase FkbM domain-containing protein n=1 Tax=Clostridium gelidum TaxID=704125 RepID=A0ABM7TBZ3_9CLOT|nr:FkbM family methyltransferase [Clostridium gelidum]BCZ48620.1 hypothetical protein psyc5s11_46870 [Clostridium gelidum]
MNIFELKKIFKINNLKELYTYLYEIKECKKLGSLDELIKTKQIVLFGAGRIGKQVLNTLKKYGFKVAYFCDNNKDIWGDCIDGVYILPPNYIKNNIKDTLVIVSMMTYVEVIKQLESMNAQYIFSDIDGTLGFLPCPNLYNNIEKLKQVNDLFIDDFSKKVYLNVIKARIFQQLSFGLSGNLLIHPIVTGPQYFDTEFFIYTDNEIFIDCGAYDGDSTVEFFLTMHQLNLKNSKVYAFEPDRENYDNFLKTIENYNLNNVKIFNYGVGNDNYNISMEQIQNCRNNNEEYEIKICKIDDIVKNEPITFIKMDIEGFELDALKGAENTIKNNKPKLAISIYHNSQDLYEIPLYLKSIVPEYKFFVRHHSNSTIFETICYAYVDKE